MSCIRGLTSSSWYAWLTNNETSFACAISVVMKAYLCCIASVISVDFDHASRQQSRQMYPHQLSHVLPTKDLQKGNLQLYQKKEYCASHKKGVKEGTPTCARMVSC